MSGKHAELASIEASLKRRLQYHFRKLGYRKDPSGILVPSGSDKDAYRMAHKHQRDTKLQGSAEWLTRSLPRLAGHFAGPGDVVPSQIRPALEVIHGGTWQSDLFRLASLAWRVPVSDGYGRRIRFLVWDRSNDKLIGLIALGDGVFNQAARDAHIGWDHRRRADGLVHLMDAYVLGAVPPYNHILGGKLVTSLLRTRDVVEAFNRKYASTTGVISQKKKRARLAAITTSSALGRSSIYNRLALDGRKVLEPIGFTSGWGHFHVSDSLFGSMREYLELAEDPYAKAFEFGSGPNWKIRVIRKAFERLGMNSRLAQHGYKRQVFFCEVAENALEFLNGREKVPRYDTLTSASEVGRKAIERWVIPRSERDDSYLSVVPEDFLSELLASHRRSKRARA